MSDEPSTNGAQSATAVVSGERYTVLVSTRVPHTLNEWLTARAADHGLSVSAMIRHELYLLRSTEAGRH